MHVLAMLLLLLAVGCASRPRGSSLADNPGARAEVERRINEVFDAAIKKDLARLDSYHLYGPKFTKFTPEAVGRQDADAARQGEHHGISAVNDLAMSAQDLKIDLFGDVAIATFVMDYSFSAGTQPLRKQALSTLVFVRDAGEWKIAHEHFSNPPTPVP